MKLFKICVPILLLLTVLTNSATSLSSESKPTNLTKKDVRIFTDRKGLEAFMKDEANGIVEVVNAIADYKLTALIFRFFNSRDPEGVTVINSFNESSKGFWNTVEEDPVKAKNILNKFIKSRSLSKAEKQVLDSLLKAVDKPSKQNKSGLREALRVIYPQEKDGNKKKKISSQSDKRKAVHNVENLTVTIAHPMFVSGVEVFCKSTSKPLTFGKVEIFISKCAEKGSEAQWSISKDKFVLTTKLAKNIGGFTDKFYELTFIKRTTSEGIDIISLECLKENKSDSKCAFPMGMPLNFLKSIGDNF